MKSRQGRRQLQGLSTGCRCLCITVGSQHKRRDCTSGFGTETQIKQLMFFSLILGMHPLISLIDLFFHLYSEYALEYAVK